MSGRDDSLLKASPPLELVGKWKDFLSTGASEDEVRRLRRHERTGRSLGSERFIAALEKTLSWTLQQGKAGPKASAHS